MSAALLSPIQPSKTAATVTTALQVETPENVVLNYQLAGPAVRCAAYLIDVAVRFGIVFVLSIVLCAGAFALPFASIGAAFVAWFVINWFYFVILEWRWRGKSVGKHAMGIRVIDRNGYPINFWSSALRNFLRFADSMPFLLHGVGFASILITKRGQRIGDLFAGTVVIAERTVRLPREPIILERIQPLPRVEIGSSFVPGPRTLAIIEQFLGRRFVLTHERGHALASVLAARLAGRLDYRGDAGLVQQYPMAFLARVYVTFLKRDDEDDDGEGFGDESSVFDSRILEPQRRQRDYYR
ncbi:MAG: RDD family protein [Planctomycetaceae bacterium]